MTLGDGSSVPIDDRTLLAPLEAALRALSWATVLAAAALAAQRLG